MKNLRHSTSRPALLFFCLMALTISFAAQAAPQKGKVFDEWGVECEATPDKKEQCFVSQTHTMKDGKGRLMKLSVGYLGKNGQPLMVSTLPLGVNLPAGAAFKVDDSKTQNKMAYQSCSNDGCMAVAPLDGATIKAMQNGKNMTIGMMPVSGGKTITVIAPLKGFQPAFASLLK